MSLQSIDWTIIGIFFAVVLGIGFVASRTAGKNTQEFFLGGRGMPWWLLGISMVACTFSCDTPNLVTGMVREDGVSKNWAWWAFLITGMVTVFIYAKLWRRSEVMTDLEFYELRYSGKGAAFLRGFRSLYLGFLFNILIMGTVTLAAIKIGGVMLNLTPLQTVVYASIFVVLYAAIGGLKGVIWADFFQYSIAMFGAVYAAYVAVQQPAVQEIGGLAGLVGPDSPIADKLRIFPDFGDASKWVPLLFIPLAVQWWAAWYPGAEPGGGGYVAQRMLAAKDEKNAIGATLLFNFLHYAMRPWPWIIVALASLVIYPMDRPEEREAAAATLRSAPYESLLIQYQAGDPSLTPEQTEEIRALLRSKDGLTSLAGSEAASGVDEQYLRHDIAYPVMISKLGPGWLGLVVASLIAAYMSTIGTHLNWGSSYVVNDFYQRFVNPKASQKELVRVGRICTVLLMLLAGLLSLTVLQDATQAFNLLILSGAGSGMIYLLRWFWWRVNAVSEISAMIVTTLTAITVTFIVPKFVDVGTVKLGVLDWGSLQFLITVAITTVTWLTATLVTKPCETKTLRNFYAKVRPGGPGWRKVVQEAESEGLDLEGPAKGKGWELPYEILCVFIGLVMIYCSLFAIGNFVYGKMMMGTILGAVAVVSCFALFSVFNKTRAN
ncbi:sodium:solute symporter family protein [Haloferula sp. A504]|uniref:sodium:solute symporter family protein n=1 Tax=Haloferula sp. A504 TaxID=3373601 RepID=UPI0031BC71B6|nr:Na+:solute symporter [Verrucomicrobiaceae bacterium E54]